MNNWAIVIGVDRYDEPHHTLRAAVSDALAMCQWLLSPGGGQVPVQQLRLLLSTRTDMAGLPVLPLPADRGSIVSAIEEVLTTSGNRADRFFFYFAGHGLNALVNLASLSAILPSDFTDQQPDCSLALRSLFELFKSTRFMEQYFFIDACRNLAFETEHLIGFYPRPRRPITPVSPQYVMYATQPGVRAAEVRLPNHERGAFTQALLAGLSGEGHAKRWNPATEQYEVRWSSLFQFVKERVRRQRLPANSSDVVPLIQVPTQYGENDGDPILAALAADAVVPATLTIEVKPDSAASLARIQVRDLVSVERNQPPPLPVPCTFELAPRTYSVAIEAHGYADTKPANIIDLYESGSLRIEMRPLQAASGADTPSPAAPASTEHARELETIMWHGERSVSDSRQLYGNTQLLVTASDSLAHIRISSAAGEQLAASRGSMQLSVAPGFYRARVLSPELRAFEKVIEVTGAEPQMHVPLTIPPQVTGPVRDVLQRGRMLAEDGTAVPSRSVGSAAFLRLSTLLALAAAAKLQTRGRGARLRELPLAAFQDLAGSAACGAWVLFGDESLIQNRWSAATVSCHPMHCSSAPAPVALQATGMQQVGAFARDLDPGAYWLQIESKDAGRISIPFNVLPNRVALFVFTQSVHRVLQLHLYQLATGAAAAVGESEIEASTVGEIRRIELMQRSVAGGHLTSALPDIAMLLDRRSIDPLAVCLGAYALLRLGRWQDIHGLVADLLHHVPQLCDAWVISAAAAEHQQRNSARQLVARALECGLPCLRDGLELLHDLLVQYGWNAEAAALERVIGTVPPGSLWSASPLQLATLWTLPVQVSASSTLDDQLECTQDRCGIKTWMTMGGSSS